MKKGYYIIAILIVVFMLTSCSGKSNKETDGEKENKFNVVEAENVVDQYMDCIETNNIEKAKTFLDKSILEKLEYPNSFELKTSGWSMEDSILAGEATIFKVRTALYSEKQPYSSIQETAIKVKKNEDDEYKIVDISSNNFKEVFQDEKKLVLRQKDNVKSQLLMKIDKLPLYTYYKNDKAKLNKVSVPRKNFGIINFAFSGNKIAISSQDNSTYVGLVYIKDVIETQGDNEDKDKKQDSKSEEGSEKPVADKILNVDLIDNAKVKEMAFCKKDKFLAVQYEGNGNWLRCYNSESGELVSQKLEKDYPVSQYDVTFEMFKLNKLIFKVKSKQGKSEKDGTYEMELTKFEINKKE